MNNNGLNGHTVGFAQYETPFADIAVAQETKAPVVSSNDFYNNFLTETDSPFSRTFEAAEASSSLTPAGEEYLSFVSELNDSEFNNAIYELAAEMEDSWMSKISNETAMGGNYFPFVTQKAREYLAPVIRESEAMIDRIAEHFSGNNLGDQSEAEIENYFDSLEFSHDFTPAQEQLFGGVFNKIKNVVKKGVDLAKKGIAIVGKILPVNIILNKIKGLVRPLLDKVLKFAIGKIPKALQPHAQTLAKKFLNLEAVNDTEATDNLGSGELEAIQAELDNNIAQLVFSPNDSEADNLVANYESSDDNLNRISNYETGVGDNQPSLQAARQQFIKELKELSDGESPAPAIERFIPVAIMALQPIIKMAISVIGRQKIINFLAGLLAKLVSKYVPANVSQPLAASIIDVGMSAIGFEVNETRQSDLGYEAIVNTVQETIQNMGQLNEATLNDSEELTMQLLEAFETAAANNFPPQYIRHELRPTKQKATWVMMPRKGPGHYYKKFTHIFDVTIDPQTATSVTTFRGLPLANFLRDKYGLDPTKPIKARAHIYEATKDTRLHRISKYEDLPGLNARQKKAWIQLNPLTTQAATLLLKEPALGKDLDDQKLATRYRTQPGHRFYYLEIEGARLRIPTKARSPRKVGPTGEVSADKESRSGDIQAVINFLKSDIRLNYYFSEEDAKAIVEKLNRNDYLGAAQNIRGAVKNVLHEMLKKNISSKVKIIHEAIPELYLEQTTDMEEQFSFTDVLGKLTGKDMIQKLVGKVVEQAAGKAYQAVLNFFKARAAEFKAAQAEPQDGVTISIIWNNVPGMSAIRTVINALKGKLSLPNLSDLSMPKFSVPEIKVMADKKFS